MALRPGQQVGQYRVEALVGRGGVASVYRVTHRDLGSRHALKVLRLPTEAVAERLLLEGRIQASLRHPNVLRVTDAIDADGRPGLVLDYVDGPALDRVLRRGRPTLAQVDAIARGMLAGVAAAHAQGSVHRDLKPANVLLDLGETVVPLVADFGIAKMLGTDGTGHTRSGFTVGTPAYMAPEQARGRRDLDERVDVFALGAILYELLTGERAFGRRTTFETLRAVTAAEPAPLDRLPAGTPARMRRTVTHALVKDRDDRARDARALLDLWVDGVAPPADVWTAADLARLRGLSPGEPSGTWTVATDRAPSLEPEPGSAHERLWGAEPALVVRGPRADAAALLDRLVAAPGRDYAGGVYRVPSPGIDSARWLAAAVGAALGVPWHDRQPVAVVGRALAARGPALLVLDEVSVRGARAVAAWCAAAPELVVRGTATAELPDLPDVALPGGVDERRVDGDATSLLPSLLRAASLVGRRMAEAQPPAPLEATPGQVRRAVRLALARDRPADALNVARVLDRTTASRWGPRAGVVGMVDGVVTHPISSPAIVRAAAALGAAAVSARGPSPRLARFAALAEGALDGLDGLARADALLDRARVRLLRRRSRPAARDLDAALEAVPRGLHHTRAAVLLARAEVATQRGRPTAAVAACREALAHAEHGGHPDHTAVARHRLARLLVARGTRPARCRCWRPSPGRPGPGATWRWTRCALWASSSRSGRPSGSRRPPRGPGPWDGWTRPRGRRSRGSRSRRVEAPARGLRPPG